MVVDAVEERVQKANLSDDSNSALQFINFVTEGRGSGSYGISSKRRNILTAANDWEMTADLSGGGTFPVEVAITNLRPDIVIWSASQQQVILGELTVPWEDNIQEAYERKYTKYTELKAVCLNRGWKATCYPFEIGCRGFVATTFQKWLRDLGFSRREVTRLSKKAAEAAETGSSWIWSKYVQKSR